MTLSALDRAYKEISKLKLDRGKVMGNVMPKKEQIRLIRIWSQRLKA